MMLHTTKRNINVFEINLSSIDGKFNITTEVSQVDKDVLQYVPNPQYKKLVDAHPHLSGVNVADVVTKAELPAHLIFGISIYPKIKMREVPKTGKEDEPIAEMTKLDWVIMFPGIEAHSR